MFRNEEVLDLCSSDLVRKVKSAICDWLNVYRVFRAQADWTFILPSELPAEVLRHLPRKMPPRSTTY
jgi:hypothetical protein